VFAAHSISGLSANLQIKGPLDHVSSDTFEEGGERNRSVYVLLRSCMVASAGAQGLALHVSRCPWGCWIPSLRDRSCSPGETEMPECRGDQARPELVMLWGTQRRSPLFGGVRGQLLSFGQPWLYPCLVVAEMEEMFGEKVTTSTLSSAEDQSLWPLLRCPVEG